MRDKFKHTESSVMLSYKAVLDEAEAEAKYSGMNDESNLREFIKLLGAIHKSSNVDEQRKFVLRKKAQQSLELLNIMTVRKN